MTAPSGLLMRLISAYFRISGLYNNAIKSEGGVGMAVLNETDYRGLAERAEAVGGRDAKHRLVEYLTIMRYIHKYLSPEMKVLEVGAGDGRYSLELAAEGYSVTAVELHQAKLDELNRKITPPMKLVTYKGEATELGFLGGDAFDLTLVLKPLSYLYGFGDKKRALSEAIRVTRPGGIVFASYRLADAHISELCFGGGRAHEFIASGLLDTEKFEFHGRPGLLCDMPRKADIDALMSHFEVTRLNLVAADIFSSHISRAIDEMDDGTFELYMKFHLSICERGDLVGAARRCIDIFRKKTPLQLRYVKY